MSSGLPSAPGQDAHNPNQSQGLVHVRDACLISDSPTTPRPRDGRPLKGRGGVELSHLGCLRAQSRCSVGPEQRIKGASWPLPYVLPGPALQGTERRCGLGGLSPGVRALEGLAPVQPPSLLPQPPSAQPLLPGTGHLPQAPLETGLAHQGPPAHWLLQTVHPGARLPPPAPNTRPRRPQPPGVVVQHEEPCVGGGVWRQVGTTPATGRWGHTRHLRPSVLPLTRAGGDSLPGHMFPARAPCTHYLPSVWCSLDAPGPRRGSQPPTPTCPPPGSRTPCWARPPHPSGSWVRLLSRGSPPPARCLAPSGRLIFSGLIPTV